MQRIAIQIAAALLLLIPSVAHTLPSYEPFDIDTADATDGSYPDFALNIGTASVNGGVLQLGLGNFLQLFTRPGFSGDLTVSGQIQSAPFDGGWQVGIAFGGRSFNIDPGYPEFLVIDTTTGDALTGPIDMGFTPSTTAFHTMELSWVADLNQVAVNVIDGDDASTAFHFAWTPHAGFDPTGRIGFTYFNGGGAGGIALFDNLLITPEPSTGSLVAAGVLGLALACRGRRAKLFRNRRERSRA